MLKGIPSLRRWRTSRTLPASSSSFAWRKACRSSVRAEPVEAPPPLRFSARAEPVEMRAGHRLAQAASGAVGRGSMYNTDALLQRLRPLFDQIAQLLSAPRRPFNSLREGDVPESGGLYAIYTEAPLEIIYLGKANRRLKASVSGQPDGLCFRIMKNHLAYQGNDNFIRYVMEHQGFAARSEARAYVRANCSVQWLEVDDPVYLTFLEHLAIAATQPRYNRG